MTDGEHDRLLAEFVLDHLCRRAVIGGVRFGTPQLLIDHRGQAPVAGQVYINLSSRWTLLNAPPRQFPDGEDELPGLEPEEELARICALREREIVRVAIAEPAPHLLLFFSDGHVLLLWGGDPSYESWTAGVCLGDPAEVWLVVACPGGGLAVWAPESFVSEFSKRLARPGSD